jgi:hypothetical protein
MSLIGPQEVQNDIFTPLLLETFRAEVQEAIEVSRREGLGACGGCERSALSLAAGAFTEHRRVILQLEAKLVGL